MISSTRKTFPNGTSWLLGINKEYTIENLQSNRYSLHLSCKIHTDELRVDGRVEERFGKGSGEGVEVLFLHSFLRNV